MIRFIPRRVIVLATVGCLALAGAAYAYFSTTGSGTGTATVGTGTVLTLHGTTAGTLYPGTSTSVSFTVDNSSSGSQQVGTIHLASVKACVGVGSAWTGSACSNSGTEATTCESVETGASDTNTANFWMADVVANQTFGNGAGQAVTAPGSLKMNNLSSSQDACKNANLLLNLTS